MQQDQNCWLGGVQAIASNLQDVTCCLACSHRQRPVLRLPHLKQSRKLKSVMIVELDPYCTALRQQQPMARVPVSSDTRVMQGPHSESAIRCICSRVAAYTLHIDACQDQ